MNSSYMTNPLVFIISTLFQLYAFAVMLRFVLQWVKADFYNPVSQFIVKVTAPVINPARRIIPGYKGLDISSLVVCYLVLMLSQTIVQALSGYSLTALSVSVLALADLVSLVINVFFYAILIQAIISWINPQGHNPINHLLYSICYPVLRPVQKLIPPVGGLDISPIFALLGLKVIEMLINPLLYQIIK